MGPIVLYLHAAITGEDADFIVKLKDVSSGRVATVLSRGWLKASHRELDPERSRPWQPFHPHTRAVPVDPGEVNEYVIELRPIATVFEKGHAIVLEVRSCDYPMEPLRPHPALAAVEPPILQQGGRLPGASRPRLPVAPGAAGDHQRLAGDHSRTAAADRERRQTGFGGESKRMRGATNETLEQQNGSNWSACVWPRVRGGVGRCVRDGSDATTTTGRGASTTTTSRPCRATGSQAAPAEFTVLLPHPAPYMFFESVVAAAEGFFQKRGLNVQIGWSTVPRERSPRSLPGRGTSSGATWARTCGPLPWRSSIRSRST